MWQEYGEKRIDSPGVKKWKERQKKAPPKPAPKPKSKAKK